MSFKDVPEYTAYLRELLLAISVIVDVLDMDDEDPEVLQAKFDASQQRVEAARSKLQETIARKRAEQENASNG